MVGRVSEILNRELLKIGFIGAGSIGSMFGGYIASIHSDENPLEIIFFCRKNHRDSINNEGLELSTANINLLLTNIKAYESAEEFIEEYGINNKYQFDYLFITTKAYDSESAMMHYNKLIKSCSWLVVLQNGVGNEEVVKKNCDENKVIRIVTSHGALMESPGKVRHTGLGFTKIGFAFFKPQINVPAYKKLVLLKTLLDAGGIKTEIVDDIIKCSWEKAFVNIGINAIGALTRLNNGELLENEYLKRFMGIAVKEALEVAKLKEIALSENNYVDLMYSVAEKTYNNKNSMLQDILKGKPTEIDFLNGKIVEFAKELNFRVPINELLTLLIKGLESSFR
ncbi:MAG: 2-dehydropantoate 2-reductase [Candidatus Lokiarchaeota archaeon]|nr:2-dehydropantoate 2-reductase [Candidatus Lokiarchaeota archaeon]